MSDKFESCVQQVKRKGEKKLNPWAVCHAALKSEEIQRIPCGMSSKMSSKNREQDGTELAHGLVADALGKAHVRGYFRSAKAKCPHCEEEFSDEHTSAKDKMAAHMKEKHEMKKTAFGQGFSILPLDSARAKEVA